MKMGGWSDEGRDIFRKIVKKVMKDRERRGEEFDKYLMER